MGMLAVGRRRLFPWPSWFVTSDPCGLFCAFLTVCLMVFAHVVTVFLVLRGSQGLLSVHAILFTLCTVMALTSHCRAQFSDPGCVPKRCVPVNPPVAQAVDGNRTLLPSSIPVAKKALLPSVCRKCKTVKPRGTHHCSVCARCISKMDHHCPWINNCVAAFNQKYFLLFLCWTGVMCIYSGCVIGVGIYRCAQSLNQCSDISAVVVVCSMLNMFEAVLFGCFVSVMLWDQLSAIFENTPYIDKLQGIKGNTTHLGRMALLTEVFGERLSWRWFVPVSLPRRVQDDFYNTCDAYSQGRLDNAHDPDASDDDS
ncbi:Palmitoyltransferase [Plasmodiophora brassicae]|uniref:Palmitoyltransferase n=1 Tax=Plasmodiophora brassicae TaxID=37360 RepID=A0A0G4ILS1_PLABS|nr:hypothetical protein PBRA_004877 [Plasmodiophora brassicae]SPQ99139.1 unnamed protein product [Plasmodiophora brassicae]